MSDLIHPSNGELEAFMLGRLSQRENRRVILHLLPGCPRCQAVTAAFWDIGTEAPASWRERFPYEPAFQRVFDRVCQLQTGLEAERVEARQLFADLKALPSGRWPGVVQKDSRFHTWGFCEVLLDQNESELFAGLALNVAARIDPESHPPVFVAELRARAWAMLSDVRLRTGDLGGAEEALRQAESSLLQGTGDRLEKARLLERKAALRHAQERSEEAARLLGRAILLYRRTGQWDQVGRVLLGLGCFQARIVPAPGRLRLLWRRLTSRSAR